MRQTCSTSVLQATIAGSIPRRRGAVACARPAFLLCLLFAGACEALSPLDPRPVAGMVWGARAGSADWCQRLRANDAAFTSLLVMRSRAMETKDWVELCAALADNTHLCELKASSHALSAEALAAFCDMLAKNGALERLALGDAELGDAGVAAICPGLAANRALQEVELDYKGLTAASAPALAGALKENQSLRRLVLSRNPGLSDSGVSALCEGLGTSGVCDLQLEEVDLTDDGLRALGAMMATCKRPMLELSLNGNAQLTGEGTTALLAGIAAGAGLECLKLDHCPQALSGEATSALAQTLGLSSCALQRVSLLGVEPPPDGKLLLAKAVGAAATLTEARLVDMQLGDSGAAALACALGANSESKLRVIDVTGNQITGEGLLALLLGDGVLDQCERLVFFDNRAGAGLDEVPHALEKAASQGAVVAGSLIDLDLGGNQLPKEWVLALLAALARAPALLPSLRTLGLGGNDGVHDVDAAFEDKVDALRHRHVPLDVVYKAMGDDGKASANARAQQFAQQFAAQAAPRNASAAPGSDDGEGDGGRGAGGGSGGGIDASKWGNVLSPGMG